MVVVKDRKGRIIARYFYWVGSLYEMQLYLNKKGHTVEEVNEEESEVKGEGKRE